MHSSVTHSSASCGALLRVYISRTHGQNLEEDGVANVSSIHPDAIGERESPEEGTISAGGFDICTYFRDEEDLSQARRRRESAVVDRQRY